MNKMHDLDVLLRHRARSISRRAGTAAAVLQPLRRVAGPMRDQQRHEFTQMRSLASVRATKGQQTGWSPAEPRRVNRPVQAGTEPNPEPRRAPPNSLRGLR